MSAQVSAEVTRLAQAAATALATGSSDSSGGPAGLEAVELAIRAGMLHAGATLLAALLAADAGHRGQRIDCGAGHHAQFVGYRSKTVHTVLGPVRLRRAYYDCTSCHRGMAPRDGDLGVDGTSTTPGLRAILDRAGATVPFARAAALLHDLAGIGVSTKRVQRTAEADGQAADAAITARATAIKERTLLVLPPDPMPDKLYLAVDGTGVPMIGAEVDGRAGKHPDGRARTREVKLAAVFTQTKLDKDGRPVRDPDSTSYLASFAPAVQFAPLLAAEARRRGADHIRQLVVLGDGAAWIWNLAGHHLPAATQIVDLYHAREHLHTLADVLAFIVPDPDQWRTDRLADLDAGDIDAITAAAHEYPLIGVKAVDRDKALAYFTTNAVRMRYAHFRDLGMFIGSGAVEAGCKAVIGQRLKLSGMRWSTPGATGILTLRAQHASAPWEQVRQHTNNQTSAPDLATNRS